MTENQASKLNIKEGTITFWVQPGKMAFDDNKTTVLVNLNSPEGSVLIVKDDDNKAKFFHVFIGKGRTDAEFDVSDLSPDNKHMFAFTWSIKEKQTKIFIDGGRKATGKISY